MSTGARRALLALVAVAVVVLLFAVVFPWFDRTFLADPAMHGAAVTRGPGG